MQESIISQGFDLMLYGMGTVFVFLAVLVVVTYTMSNVVNKFFPEPAEPELAPTPAPSAKPGSVDSKTLQVIKEAIAQHRSKRGR